MTSSIEEEDKIATGRLSMAKIGPVWGNSPHQIMQQVTQHRYMTPVTERRVSNTNLDLATPNFAEHPRTSPRDQPRHHRTVYTTFQSHQQSYPTESQTNRPTTATTLSYSTTPYNSLVPVTTNVSNQPLRQLHRAPNKPRPTNGTYEAGQWKTKLDEHRR